MQRGGSQMWHQMWHHLLDPAANVFHTAFILQYPTNRVQLYYITWQPASSLTRALQDKNAEDPVAGSDFLVSVA